MQKNIYFAESLLLDLFIYKIISDNPKLKHKEILSFLIKSVGKKIKLDGYNPIIVIKEIHENHLTWQDTNGNPHKAKTLKVEVGELFHN